MSNDWLWNGKGDPSEQERRLVESLRRMRYRGQAPPLEADKGLPLWFGLVIRGGIPMPGAEVHLQGEQESHRGLADDMGRLCVPVGADSPMQVQLWSGGQERCAWTELVPPQDYSGHPNYPPCTAWGRVELKTEDCSAEQRRQPSEDGPGARPAVGGRQLPG